MTLSNTSTSVTVQGDSLTTTFSYTFPMGGSSSYAVLIFTDSGGTTSTITASNFSITGVTSSTGGTFTYPLSGTAITAGESLTLQRTLPLTQNSAIANLGTFAPATTEGALDYEMMAIQQLERQITTLQTATGSGTVTSVATGNGLTGGPITGSGTLSVDAGTGLTFTGTQLIASNFVFAQTASVTVSNTTSEATLVGAGNGSVTLTTSYFAAGTTLRWWASGFHSATATPNITVKAKLGGTTIASTGAVASVTASSTYWECRGQIVCVSEGATGSFLGQGFYMEATGGQNAFGMVNTAGFTLNTTTSLAFDLTAQWSAASVTNSITCTNLLIEQAGA